METRKNNHDIYLLLYSNPFLYSCTWTPFEYDTVQYQGRCGRCLDFTHKYTMLHLPDRKGSSSSMNEVEMKLLVGWGGADRLDE